jgi:type IV secretion system protein VirD4
MTDLGRQSGISDLVSAAAAIRSGLGSNALNSVMDSARRYLSVFARSQSVMATMIRSDWKPLELRTRPGTTVYINIPPQELKAYAAVVRLMLVQHQRLLMKHPAKRGEQPVTFFLDEMPQLGNFESILEMQDVGRGAGLRLWMFAQSVGQLAKAFGRDRYEGVIDACRCRSYLQPDKEALDLIKPSLGKVRNMFTKEEYNLVEDYELMVRTHHDKIITTTRGDHPMLLTKRYAYQQDQGKKLKPPLLKKVF